jgi:large subunit ribosomal protein L11
MPVPVVITVFADKTFAFECKSPPAVALLKEAAGLAKGSGEPNKEKVGRVTLDQCREIAERKLADLSARDVEAGARIIAGTARSMGIVVEGN